jgi:hypothetical protein
MTPSNSPKSDHSLQNSQLLGLQRWNYLQQRLPKAVRAQIRRWQKTPRTRPRAIAWHLVVATDGEPIMTQSFPSLTDLVEAARFLYREQTVQQVFIFRGARYLTEVGPKKRLILSKHRRIALVPMEQRSDLAPDLDGFLSTDFGLQLRTQIDAAQAAGQDAFEDSV